MMNRLYHVAASARSALFCQSRSTAATARQLDPTIRDALAETLQHDTQTIDVELHEIEADLERAVGLLKEFEAKEQFLGVRTRKYRQVLDQQALALKQEGVVARANKADQPLAAEATDEEAASDYEARMEKWEKDTDALESIIKTHTQILAQCEQMRRNIKDLEAKQKKIQRMNVDCHDFLEEAAQHKGSATEDEDGAVEEGLSGEHPENAVEVTNEPEANAVGSEDIPAVEHKDDVDEDVGTLPEKTEPAEKGSDVLPASESVHLKDEAGKSTNERPLPC
jgi:DNA repair exonuclease SbcCD ATPase subunit